MLYYFANENRPTQDLGPGAAHLQGRACDQDTAWDEKPVHYRQISRYMALDLDFSPVWH